MQPNVCFNITEQQFSEILDWMTKEYAVSKKGSFNNIHLIEQCYRNDEISIINLHNKVVGFATWRNNQAIRTIENVEIHPEFRNKGMCRTLIKLLEIESQKDDILVLDLQCSPASSEIIWKRLGFVEFPCCSDGSNFIEGNRKLYKILTPVFPVSTTKRDFENNTLIEIWDKFQHEAQEIQPKWIWDLSNLSSKFSQPIVIPGLADWRIRYSYLGTILYDGRVKWFSKKQIDIGNFIIIKEIPLELREGLSLNLVTN